MPPEPLQPLAHLTSTHSEESVYRHQRPKSDILIVVIDVVVHCSRLPLAAHLFSPYRPQLHSTPRASSEVCWLSIELSALLLSAMTLVSDMKTYSEGTATLKTPDTSKGKAQKMVRRASMVRIAMVVWAKMMG